MKSIAYPLLTLLVAVTGAAAAEKYRPEPVSVVDLPLPPTAPSSAAGACTSQVNPRGTGCMSASDYGTEEGPSYLPDGRHVLLTVIFAGAPAAPNPASVYSGPQVIAIRTDGTRFPNGDAWKCLTCGVPAANSTGTNQRPFRDGGQELGLAGLQPVFDHPQAFPDGKRVLAGTNILDCGAYRVTEAACTPQALHIYPLAWGAAPEASGGGPSIRELRLNPDGVHIGWSAFVPPPRIDEFGFFGRLVFKPAAGSATGHYEIEKVSIMLNNSPAYAAFMPDPNHPGDLLHNPPRGVIGEFRGFTSDGKAALGVFFEESGNIDLFATDLKTGVSTRLTRDTSYTDPAKTSPDDRWLVYMNPRQSDRHMYFAGLRGIPPLADLMTVLIETCCYNNGYRRFFQPYLLATDDHREDYPGQQLNAGPGTAGSPSDPNWNGRADPTWSPDGTHVVYWQALLTSPACGGSNPLPCPTSTEPGGRRTRLMMATLTGRKPQPIKSVNTVSDAVPWGIPYRAGDPLPVRGHVQPGKYILEGQVSGQAEVQIDGTADAITAVAAKYTDFSDDGRHVINGTERVASDTKPGRTVWHSDIRASGAQQGTKVTREPGGFVFGFGALGFGIRGGPVSGTLTTTIDGHAYTPPAPGT